MEDVRDDAWFEREYNPRLTVPDADAVFAAWVARSQETRAEHPLERIGYGAHPRQFLDIFRAEPSRGMVVFIHGGYFRALSTAEHSFVARPWLAQGYSVALINYPLCPEVRVIDIVASCRTACAALWQRMDRTERSNAIVTGHSAGGYLAAAMVTTDWAAFGLPARPFGGALSLSGVFALEPLLRTSMNALIGLTADDVRDWSLTRHTPASPPALLLAVGGDEPEAFHHQSRSLAASWALVGGAVAAIAGRNHFTIVEDFARHGTVVHAVARSLLR